jgi:hypothetical protein
VLWRSIVCQVEVTFLDGLTLTKFKASNQVKRVPDVDVEDAQVICVIHPEARLDLLQLAKGCDKELGDLRSARQDSLIVAGSHEVYQLSEALFDL